MEVENMLTTDDRLLIGVHFDGSIEAGNVWLASPGAAYVPYAPVDDFDAIRVSTGGEYWQDEDNNRVWVMLRGGTWQPGNWEEWVTTPDHLLYETTYLRIAP
jgi:hypothetical protein